jgi:hypothetical protein
MSLATSVHFKIIAKKFFKRYINTVHKMDKEDEQVWHLLHLRGIQLHY